MRFMYIYFLSAAMAFKLTVICTAFAGEILFIMNIGPPNERRLS